jgi:hypothetical protein
MGGDVSPAELVKYFRGDPPDEPERIYRLTREGAWKRGGAAIKLLRFRNKHVAVHGRVRWGASRTG